jgi:hypothetical protein
VEIDMIDHRLEVQAADKGIPTLMASRVGEAVTAVEDARTSKPVSLKVRRAGPIDQSTTPRARMKTLNVEVPDYAWVAIKTRAAQEMVSARHVIMSALRANGIEIKDTDIIEDGRRLRGTEAG